MGCGCRKPKKTKETIAKLTPKQREQILNKSKAALKKARVVKQIKMSDTEKNRLFICDQCSHSTQSEKDKIHKIRICHKLNRPLTFIAKNTDTTCPIGRFS